MSIYNYHILSSLGLPEKRVLRLLPLMEQRTFAADEVVCAKGSAHHAWFHVVSGLVGASTANSDVAGGPVDIYGARSWFGEAVFVNKQNSSFDYVCLTPARLICMPYADAMEAFETEPNFSRYIARMVAWRNQQHTEMLHLLKSGSPQLRVAMGLAMFAETLNRGASHIPSVSTEDELEIPVKQLTLAQTCGVSRGVFSEFIQQMAADGWIKVNYSTLTLLKTKTWERFTKQYRQAGLQTGKPSAKDVLSQMRAAAISPELL